MTQLSPGVPRGRGFRSWPSLALLMMATATYGQAEPAPVPPPSSDPPQKQPETPPPPAPLPSLDELLGLDESAEPRQGEGLPQATDPNQSELDRKLSGREVAQAFQDAVRLMGDSAGRIKAARDVGISTQRLQEEAIRKLDLLISQAQRQQSQSSSSSSSSQDRQNQPQPNQPQQGQPQNQAGNTENRGQVDPPARQEGPLGPDATGSSAGWGNLPARVRDALMQSQQDSVSALYRAMTEAYYRRIAEEAGK